MSLSRWQPVADARRVPRGGTRGASYWAWAAASSPTWTECDPAHPADAAHLMFDGDRPAPDVAEGTGQGGGVVAGHLANENQKRSAADAVSEQGGDRHRQAGVPQPAELAVRAGASGGEVVTAATMAPVLSLMPAVTSKTAQRWSAAWWAAQADVAAANWPSSSDPTHPMSAQRARRRSPPGSDPHLPGAGRRAGSLSVSHRRSMSPGVAGRGTRSGRGPLTATGVTVPGHNSPLLSCCRSGSTTNGSWPHGRRRSAHWSHFRSASSIWARRRRGSST